MAERLLLFFLFLFCAMYFYATQQLDFGTILKPQAGFLPSIAGLSAVLLTLLLLVRSIIKNHFIESTHINWTKFVLICVGLAAFMIILNLWSYFAATLFFLFYLFKIVGAPGILNPLIIAFSSTVFFYTLFVVYLMVPLSR